MIVITSRKGFLITGFFVLLLGIGLIAGGIIYRNQTYAKLESWTHVNAVVIGYEVLYKTDSDGTREEVFYATVEYTVDSQTYRKTSETGSGIPPSKGTSREIAYNPDNPAECIFVEGGTDLIMIFLCVCGGAFAFAGILVFVTYGFKKK